MKKYLRMNETVIDMETGIEFIKGRYYEVMFEADDHYQLGSQHNIVCGMGKSLEGLRYNVILRVEVVLLVVRE